MGAPTPPAPPIAAGLDTPAAPTAEAPPPPPEVSGLGEPNPPAFPCGGLTGGVFPDPTAPPELPLTPPPDPPDTALAPGPCRDPPDPPPADVIVENIEFVPFPPLIHLLEFPAPPAPTVIGKDVPPLKVNFVPPGNEVL